MRSSEEIFQFYQSRKGVVAEYVVSLRLRALWPDVAGRRVLGLGYTAPYLDSFGEAERLIAVQSDMPSAFAPAERNCALAAEENSLPFPDAMFDCVLVAHGLEQAESQRHFMREIWRILAPAGKLVVVVPNRASLWAQLENTPFGHGRPYTKGQLETFLRDNMFAVERADGALFMPPFGVSANLRAASRWDRIGRRFWPRLAGVHIVEASKEMYATVPPAKRSGILARATSSP